MPLRFTIRQLEYLVAVAEAGSIAGAADRVNVSSPSISAAISQLEADFGHQFFIRKHAQGLSLTQTGRQFLIQARKVLHEARTLNRLADDISGKVQGTLALGCLLTFAQFMAPQLRRGFETRHEGVRVTQSELNHEAIIAGLRAADLDIALTYDLDIPSDLVFLPLVALPPYVILPAAHPLAGRSQVSLADLLDQPMVLLDLPFSTEYFLSVFKASGIRPRIAERTRDLAVVRSLVANGFGYAIANIRPLNENAPDGRPLRFVPLAGDNRPMVMGLLMAEGSDTILTLRAFVDHCRDVVTEDSVPGMRMQPWPGPAENRT